MVARSTQTRVALHQPTTLAQPLLDHFLQDFQGHYDNHAQVASETEAGIAPREGGGHEHIHCHLRKVTIGDAPGQHVLASYYFNGQPAAVFRERLYAVDALAGDPQFGACVRMRIYKLCEPATAQLRAGSSVDDITWTASSALGDELHVTGADVFWRWCGERFEGEMRTESVEIVSERSGERIKVRDDVALWADALWVNDRGCNAETGEYIYGNIHDIPYKMQRVSDTHWTVTGEAAPLSSVS